MLENRFSRQKREGTKWKKHKYIRIENGRYIYPADLERQRRAAANRIKSTLSRSGASYRSKFSSSRANRTLSRRTSSAKASSARTVSSSKQRGRDLVSRLFGSRKISSAFKSASKTTRRASSISRKKTIEKGKKALNRFVDEIAKKTNLQSGSKTKGKGQNNSAKTYIEKITRAFPFARNEKTRKKEEPKRSTSQPSKPTKTSGSSSGLETSKNTSSKSTYRTSSSNSASRSTSEKGTERRASKSSKVAKTSKNTSSKSTSRTSSSKSASRSTSEKETKSITDPKKMNPYLLFSKLTDKLGKEFDSDWIKSRGKDGDLESGLRVVFSEQLGYDLSDRKIEELADYMEVEESLPSSEKAEELSAKELFDMMKKHNHDFQMSGEKIRDYVEDGKLTSGIDLAFSEEFGYDLSSKKLQELANYVEQHDKVESMSSSALINQLKQSERYKSLSLKALKDGASDKKLLTGIHAAFEAEYGYDLSDKKLKEIAKYLKSKAELDDTKDKGKKAVAKATKK